LGKKIVAKNQVAPPKQAPVARWTVMVFMAAEDVEGFAPLAQEARDDVAEMESLPPSPNLDIFVQLHSNDGAVRFRVGYPPKLPVPDNEKQHDRGRALTSFMRWALGAVAPRPTDRSMLVLWGHTYKFAIGQTLGPNGEMETLDFVKLTDALQGLQGARAAEGYPGKLVDIIGFDSCDLSAVEVAVQLEPFADFLLASEMGIPLPGWPYDRVLDRLRDPKGLVMAPMELGAYAVRRYCETYSTKQRAVSLTLLNLKRAQEVREGVERLAQRLAIAVGRSAEEKATIRALFSQSQTDAQKPFVDVADLCLNLVRRSDDPDVRQSATEIGDLLVTPDPVLPGGSQEAKGRPFVVEHGRNAVRAAKLNGVSLYAPHVASDHDFAAAKEAYELFAFAEDSLWTRLVHNLAASS
jgi:hypothetical protein